MKKKVAFIIGEFLSIQEELHELQKPQTSMILEISKKNIPQEVLPNVLVLIT